MAAQPQSAPAKPSAATVQQRIEAIRAKRAAGRSSDRASGVINGVPGWSYYVTFADMTPARVEADLRAGGWALADAEHADVVVTASAGHDPTKVRLWVKPAAVVAEDLEVERATRPRPSALSSRGMRAR
jgi:hypothetical protein